MEANGLDKLKEVKKTLETSEESRIIKVGSQTNAKELGKSIYATFTKEGLTEVTVRAIGAGAISQALKAIIISGTYLAARGARPAVYPSFKDLTSTEADREITAMELLVRFEKI